MEPQTKRLEYKVGLFIGAGLLALTISIFLLNADGGLFTRSVEYRARFFEVQGLFPGSIVSLAGVKVGNVRTIKFAPDGNQLEVTMAVNRAFRERLVMGTVAEIRTQGALGDKFIYLKPGDPGSPFIEHGTYIETSETDLLDMLTNREDGVARVIDLIKEMHFLVASINSGGKTAETVRNLADASVTLKASLTQLDGLLGDLRAEIPENRKLRGALVSLSNVIEKIDQGQGTLGQLINDPSLHQNLKSLLGGSPRNRYMKDMIRETIQRSDTTQ